MREQCACAENSAALGARRVDVPLASRGAARDAARRRAHSTLVAQVFWTRAGWYGSASRRPAPGDFRPCRWHFGFGRTRTAGTLAGFWRWGIGSRRESRSLRPATLPSLCASGLGAAPSCPGALRQGPVRAVANGATPDFASFVTRHAAGRRLNPAIRTVRTAPSTLRGPLSRPPQDDGKQREHYKAGWVRAG